MKITETKYSLIENSYLFLNESLKNVESAKKNNTYWTFAIIHLIQSLELFCKYLLYIENPVLICADIDNIKNEHTVTFQQAINRLENLVNIHLEEKEKLKLLNAYKLRNQITHFEFNFNSAHFEDIYRTQFEFFYIFHKKHLNHELHDYIESSLVQVEAELINDFKKNTHIEYQGSYMSIKNPMDILKSQKWNAVSSNGNIYKRIRCGDETRDFWTTKIEKCHDCGVIAGQIHTSGCDTEQCPICHKQFLSCNCIIEDYLSIDE